MCLYVCIYFYVSVCLYIFLCICMSVYISMCLYVCIATIFRINVTGRKKVTNLAWSFFSPYLLILSVEPVPIFQDGGQNPRWLPEKKGNVMYLAVKIGNEQTRCQLRFFRGH